MRIFRNFAKCGGRDALTVLACTVVAFTAVAVAVAIIDRAEDGILEIPPLETATANSALPTKEYFYVVRIPTQGRLAEPVECHGADRASFSIEYLHSTISGEDWRGGQLSEPLGRGHYGEHLRPGSSIHELQLGYHVGPLHQDDRVLVVGTKIYAHGVPGERVLVKAPTATSRDRCFVGQLTDERLPP
ncbi:MAG: hypothetical protein OXF79_14770 [Chloroflexi bacterium]|nr:hypothetical protein [Chloroflexota bacterium]